MRAEDVFLSSFEAHALPSSLISLIVKEYWIWLIISWIVCALKK